MDDFVLLPVPQKLERRSGSFRVDATIRIGLAGEPDSLVSTARRLQTELGALTGARTPIGAADSDLGEIAIRIDRTQRVPCEGYRLDVSEQRVELIAGDAAGAFYGVATLIQCLRQSGAEVPCVSIEDYPDLASRGVMLDVSRDKVPTLETLFELIDMLAELKVNHLELYTEHTFAYRNHREVWAQASPYTADDMLAIDAYCRQRFVELVPNQNSFGHLNRWLELPRYRHLAECPEGFELPWGARAGGPFSLNPNHPEALALVAEWFDELLPNFTSKKLNVGCDETWDLGKCASKQICEARGTGRVYLDFVRKLHELVSARGRTMHFWGDIILKHPELVGELPKDVVPLAWGYEADHPFDAEAAQFKASGLPFYVCPGTSSWNTFVGRTKNCLGNITRAAEAAIKHGAIGMLNTDWGDNGHLQYLPVSYFGFAAGAALSWSYACSRDTAWDRALDLHVFRDRAGVMGRAILDLGDSYLKSGVQPANGAVAFQIIRAQRSAKLAQGVNDKTLAATAEHIEGIVQKLASARMQRVDADLVRREIENGARMASHGCKKGIAMFNGSIGETSVLRELATDMRIILGEHRELWMARNRVGGLQDSPRALEQCLAEYTESDQKNIWA